MPSNVRAFVRRGAHLTLHRERQGRYIALVATESGRPRTFPFRSAARLAVFQEDMENFLYRTGWSLANADSAVSPPSAQPSDADGDCGDLRLTFAEEEVGARR